MIDKLTDALNTGKLTTHDLEAAERLFRFLADALKETQVELAMTGFDSELERLVLARQFIDAIKLYRVRRPGTGLKEAKDAVEAIGERLGAFNRMDGWRAKP